jgi:hypothetical protein
MRSRLDGRDCLGLDERLSDGMIDRQLLDLLAANLIRPAVADTGDVQFAALAPQGQHDGGAHVAQVAVERAHRHDFFIGLDNRLADEDFGVVGIDVGGEGFAQFARNDVDGFLAGDFTGGLAAGGACVIEAEQLCLLLGEDRRGDERVITQAFTGVFEDSPPLRSEFLRAIGGRMP